MARAPDPIEFTMLTQREPLPYPHQGMGEDGWTIACTSPETPSRLVHATIGCPGCRAFVMADALKFPDLRWSDTSNGGADIRAIDALRRSLDEFDPMRVVFERELARRGIS